MGVATRNLKLLVMLYVPFQGTNKYLNKPIISLDMVENKHIVKLRSIGLSDKDVEKLDEIMVEHDVSSRSDMVRRLIFCVWANLHEKK